MMKLEDVLAVDIGGTSIKFAKFDPAGNIERCGSIKTEIYRDSPAFYDALFCAMPDLGGISRIGVSAPGLISAAGDVRSYGAPNLKNLYGTNIVRELFARTGKPVYAINDGKAAGLCELSAGSALGASSAVCYIIGTGIAGCICIDGRIYGGADNFAGEFHFISHLDNPGEQPMRCGRECGNLGLVQLYNKSTGESAVNGREVLNMYRAGSEPAAAAVSLWLELISTHLLSIISVLNPQLACIGGGVMEQDWFFKALCDTYRDVSARVFESADFLSTRLVPCAFGSDSNLYGAAICAQNGGLSRREAG